MPDVSCRRCGLCAGSPGTACCAEQASEVAHIAPHFVSSCWLWALQFEKMTAGLYTGDIARRLLLRLVLTLLAPHLEQSSSCARVRTLADGSASI